MGGYIAPANIVDYEYDYIYITSLKYFQEIKKAVINIIGDTHADKIISCKEVFGDFSNAEIRHQWVATKLSEIPEGKILLDAGAGEQRYRPYCSHLKYIAQDFGKYIPNETDVGIQEDSWNYRGLNITCDIIDMPFDKESIDAILCTEVLEHIKSPELAIKEFSRVLKPEGKLILTAPFCSLTHMAPYYYCNGFSEFWYKEILMDYGFKIVELTPNGNYFKYLSQELIRVNEMAELYCHSRLSNEEVEMIIGSLEALSRLSSSDVRSNETLCFGYMVVATKL